MSARPATALETLYAWLDRVSPINFAVVLEGTAPVDLDAAEARIAALGAPGCIGARRLAPAPGGGLLVVEGPGTCVPCLRIEGAGGWGALERLTARRIDPAHEVPVRGLLQRRDCGGWRAALIFHHAFADGRHGLRLLHGVLTGAPETPGCRPLELDALPDAQVRAARRYLAETWGAAGPLSAVPPISPDGDESFALATARIDLTERETGSLLRQVRARGLRLHSLLCALQAQAFARVMGAPSVVGLISPVDLRRGVDTTLGAGLLVQRLHITPEGDPFAAAKGLQRDFEMQHRLEMPRVLLGLLGPSSGRGFDGFRARSRMSLQGGTLSNVGRVEGIGTRARFVACPQPGQPFFATAATGADGLSLTLCTDRRRSDGGALARAMSDALRRVTVPPHAPPDAPYGVRRHPANRAVPCGVHVH